MFLVLCITAGAVLFTLIKGPDVSDLSRWDYAGGVFMGTLSYWLLTKI